MNNREKNSYVKSRILEALLELTRERSFGEISISALTERAGVGRASFYRNFKSREDVLRQENRRLMELWRLGWEREPGGAENFLVSLLDFYKEHSVFYLALYRAGLFSLLLDDYLNWQELGPELPNALAYLKSSIAYMIYGWVVEWARRGMPESGTELARMIAESQKNEPGSTGAEQERGAI